MAGYVMRSTVIVPVTVAELEQGQTVAKGTAVDLPEAYGDHLVAEKLAKRDDNALAEQEQQAAIAEEEQAQADRAEKIAEIIELLPDEAFTEDGKPKVDAINAAMPGGADAVTAIERDAVWDRMENEE